MTDGAAYAAGREPPPRAASGMPFGAASIGLRCIWLVEEPSAGNAACATAALPASRPGG